MVSISENGIITMNSGDYLRLPIFINAGDYINPYRYTLQDEDKIYFSIVEAHQSFENGVVRKILTVDDLNSHGDAILELFDSDTELVHPGNYYYEIKLSIRKNDMDYVNTIVPRRKLVIL